MARSAEICRRLRQGIVNGLWPMGSNLPTRAQLARELHCSQRLLQEAIAILIDEGLLHSLPRQATRVIAQALPRILVLLPHGSGDPQRGLLDRSIERLAAQAPRRRTLGCHLLPLSGTAADLAAQLRPMIGTGGVDGIILRGEPDEQDELVTACRPAPMVAIGVRNHQHPVPCIHLPHDQMVEQGIQHLLAANCQRLVALTHIGHGERLSHHLRPMIHGRASLEVVELPLHHERGARQWVDMLLDLRSDRRPDGLMVGIDGLAAAVCALLAENPMRARGLQVAVHANRPGPDLGGWPCHRVGHDLQATLAIALDLIARQRRGDTVPLRTTIMPVDTALRAHDTL